MTAAAIVIASQQHPAFDDPLALIPFARDQTLIEWQIEQLAGAGVRDIVVVLGYEAERVLPLVTGDNVDAIVDSRWVDGQASALRVGASAVPRGTDAALILDIAQPRSSPLCWGMLLPLEPHHAAIRRPVLKGVPGAPVLVDEAALAALRNFSGDGGLDAFVTAYPGAVTDVEANTNETLMRIDSPADVEPARVAVGMR